MFCNNHLFLCSSRLELVDSSVSHQREKQMTVFDRVRSDKLPVLGDAIIERPRRAHRPRSRHETELELIRSRRFPCSASAVAVDSRAHATIVPEGDGILRLVIGRQHLAITTLELHQLPRRAAEGSRRVLRRGLRACATSERHQERQQQ